MQPAQRPAFAGCITSSYCNFFVRLFYFLSIFFIFCSQIANFTGKEALVKYGKGFSLIFQGIDELFNQNKK